MTLKTILSIINLFLVGFLLGKHVQEEYYTPKPVHSGTVNVDSLVAVSDSIQNGYIRTIDSLTVVHEGETKRMSDGYQEMLGLTAKYEMALDEMRDSDIRAYMHFIRIAQFKEEYNESVHREFILQNKVKRYSAAQAFK